METTILLVDDHPVFRKGLRMMLEEEEGLRVVGEAGNGAEALEKAREHRPDVIIMDISMPDVDGIEGTRRIVTEFPDAKVIPLSIHSGKRFVQNMLRSGAAGYVLKESAPEDLVDAIRTVAKGNVFLSSAISGVVVSEYVRLLDQPAENGEEVGLTEREGTLLGLIAEGYSVHEIAEEWKLGAGTVQSARRRLMKKLGLENVHALGEFAVARHWSQGEIRLEVSGTNGGDGGMPILATKLHPPNLPTAFVSRSRLLDQLEGYRDHALTLISAPAGSGKTTVLAEWIAEKKRPTVWLSLDSEDSEPGVFLTYFVAAVEAVYPGSCQLTASLLRAPRLPAPRIIAGYLANDLGAIGASFDLVLDDYYQIHGSAIHEILSEVFLHPPLNVHWLILTRHDPPIPLAGLRAGGKFSEIRYRDLRATAEEAAALIQSPSGPSLGEAAFERLYDATEGWITAQQLISLAQAKRKDSESLIAELDSVPHGIQAYLTEQVLSAQAPEFQNVLLKISILDRFCIPLCEAVCREEGALEPDIEGFVARLIESGLFVIRMDSGGKWFRFHQLFQHFLEQKLEETAGEKDRAKLHLRASLWFEEHGLIDEALIHAFKAGDPIRGAEIVERHLHAQLNADRWQVVERWLARVPVELMAQRPKLLLAATVVAVERSRIDEVLAQVRRIETLIDDQGAEPDVLGALNLFRGQIRYWQGEPGRALDFFLEARGQIPPAQQLTGGENELHLALARQALGQHLEAVEDLKGRMRDSPSAEPIYLSRLVAAQSFVDLLSGELAPAAEAARRLETMGGKHGILYTKMWGTYLRAVVQFQWNDMEAAVRGFSELAEHIFSMHSRAAADALAGLAFTCEATSRPNEAMAAARKLREFAEESGDPQLQDVAGSCEARLAVWRGDLEPALRWQRSFRETPDIPSMFLWLELPSVTECRVLIARGTGDDLQEAGEKLATLREGLSGLHNTYRLIDVALLQALALEKQECSAEALKALQCVIEMAEPGGWIRPFVEAGPLVVEMLDRLELSENHAKFASQLRASMARSFPEENEPAEADSDVSQPLIDALTHRELDVLEKVAERLYDKEIATRLSISPETVKSHLKHIYQKLDVKNRRQAVSRAEALGILSPPR